MSNSLDSVDNCDHFENVENVENENSENNDSVMNVEVNDDTAQENVNEVTEEKVVEEEKCQTSTETKLKAPVKYYDVDEIWNESAKPDDILVRYVLALKWQDKVLVAHMIEDPLLEITKKEVKWMQTQGFVLQKTENVKRCELNDKDISLLRKSQFINPTELE